MEESFRYTSDPMEKEKVTMLQKWIRSEKAQRAKRLVFEAADGNTYRGAFVSQYFGGKRASNEPESAGGVIVVRGDAGDIKLDVLDIIAWWIE